MLAQVILAAISVSAASAPVPAAHAALDAQHITPTSPHPVRYIHGTTMPLKRAADRLIGGIISYVRWPDARPVTERHICVVGTPALTDSLSPALPGSAAMRISYHQARDVTQADGCDALFLGQIPVADRQRLIGWVRGKSILTLTDTDPDCSGGTMFCLVERQRSLSFSVNLDAIGRGPLRVDPRVLRIGKEAAV